MIYVGKMYVDGSSGVLRERRVGFEKDNGACDLYVCWIGIRLMEWIIDS